MAITEVQLRGLRDIKARELVEIKTVHATGAITPDNILKYAFALGRNWLNETYPGLWEYNGGQLTDDSETWTFGGQFQWNDKAWREYRKGAGDLVPLSIDWHDPEEEARNEQHRAAVAAARIYCHACNGTGVYTGFAELKGVGVVCNRCGGSGAAHKDDPRFEGRKRCKGIKVVAYSQGIVLDIEWALKTGGISYEEFFSGKMPTRTLSEVEASDEAK